jgi:twitching motility protein PilT
VPIPVVVLDLDRLLRFAVDQGASDVHVKVGARPRLRVDGVLRESPFETVEPADTERTVMGILPKPRVERFRATNEADFVYAIAGLGRFRVSAFRQRGWVGLVLRRVLPGIPGFEALGLPASVAALASAPKGLVLVTGLAGSGRTSTLAAMVDHVNSTRDGHIVTIEDPVEVLHADKRSIVDQREVGIDTPGFREAVMQALRQDPDVVMIGELRDDDATTAALHAAETGHLVFASLPALGAVESLARVVELYPPDRQAAVRATLARTLRGVVSQRLLPRVRGRGRIPAVEILVANARVLERVADPMRAHELTQEMIDGALYGMQTFDQSLVELYTAGLVGRDEVVAQAVAPAEIRFALDRADAAREFSPSGPVAPPIGQVPTGRPAVQPA